MTPTRRHPDAFRVGPGRREITVAVLAALGVLVFTGVMLWALGPHDGGGDSSPSPTPTIQTTPTTAPTSAPTGDTAATSTPAGDTTATSAPTATTAAPSTAAPGGG